MPLPLLFIYACCLAMSLPLFCSSLHLLYFIPLLILSFYRCSLPICLWWALSCGFIIDLLSAQTRLGIYAFNYCLTTLFLYRYKFYFFEDRPSTLPLMTFCFACLSTMIQAATFYTIGKPFLLSWEWMKNDLFWMPVQDAIYAGLCFSLPSFLFSKIRWRFLFFLLTKRRKISRTH